MRLYGTIEKAELQEDGTIIVTGYASSEDVDSQGEIVTAEAMKAALPDYMKFANIREMHQPKAAGVALEAAVQDDGRTWLKAHIVDDDAIRKVQKHVYKGFSIGGKITGRDKTNNAIITGLQLSEISLVDRPANSQAVFSIGKVDLGEVPDADQSLEVEQAVETTANEAEKADMAAEKENPLAKGMYLVGQLAAILDALAGLQQCSEWEEAMENDDSDVPAQLKGSIADLSAVLRNMVAEETAELTEEDDLEMAAKIADLDKAVSKEPIEKAGARNSKEDLEKIQSMHDSTVELGAACASEKVDYPTTINKIASLESTLSKLATENSNLKNRVEELEALPKPPKASVKALSKADDAPIIHKQEEEPKDTLSAIKKVHSTGGRIIHY